MEGPNRRMYARYPCRLGCSTRGTGSQTLTGEIVNLGMGGALVRILGVLGVRRLTLQVAAGSQLVQVDIVVVRSQGPDPAFKGASLYGVEFGKDPMTQQGLRVLIDQVRTRSNLGGPKTMSGYWKR